MARALPDSAGVVFCDPQGPGLVADGSGDVSTAYQIYQEPAALPVRWALSELLDERLAAQLADAVQILALAGSEIPELTEWVRGAWRIAFSVQVVRRLARALDEWHVRGSAHGGLTPLAVMVVSIPGTTLSANVKAQHWQSRSAACTEMHWEPKVLDVGLGPYLSARFDQVLAKLGLRFEGGKLKGDLSTLTSDEIEWALFAAANPLRLYRAPDRILADAPPGPADDLYFCGCLLYELLTGRHPYEGTNPYATLMTSLSPQARPRPLDAYNPALGPALASIVERAVAPSENHRFATCAELALALEDWEDDGPDDWLST